MLHVRNDRQDMLVVSSNGLFKFNLKLVRDLAQLLTTLTLTLYLMWPKVLK